MLFRNRLSAYNESRIIAGTPPWRIALPREFEPTFTKSNVVGAAIWEPSLLGKHPFSILNTKEDYVYPHYNFTFCIT